jgi:signal transduction histidine kinase
VLNSSVTRTTTFRLSAIFGAVFVAGIMLLLGLVYVQTASYLTRRVDRALTEEANNLRQSGPESILRRFRRDSALDPLNSFGLFSSTGDMVAGDTPLTPGSLPLDGKPRDIPRRGGASPARALAERMPWGETLIVERDTSQIEELRKIVFGALMWSGAFTVVFGLGSSLLLSLRPLRRIQAMQAASDAISSGEFSRRLPRDNSRDELDELARIANVMMDEAERLMNQARTVGEGVAHELRTPLTRLRALLDHASEDFEGGDPRRALLDQCVAETDGVLARFRALLRIAALESRGRRTGISTVSLNIILDQIHELYGPLAAELETTLDIEQPLQDLQVRVDPELLIEALSNIVDNALKFTPKGGQVTVTATPIAEGAVVEVRDNGPGIPDEEHAFVTKRFYRSQRHANIEGHGLGLSLVASIADLHGFELSFHDADPGAVVRLVLRDQHLH